MCVFYLFVCLFLFGSQLFETQHIVSNVGVLQQVATQVIEPPMYLPCLNPIHVWRAHDTSWRVIACHVWIPSMRGELMTLLGGWLLTLLSDFVESNQKKTQHHSCWSWPKVLASPRWHICVEVHLSQPPNVLLQSYLIVCALPRLVLFIVICPNLRVICHWWSYFGVYLPCALKIYLFMPCQICALCNA